MTYVPKTKFHLINPFTGAPIPQMKKPIDIKSLFIDNAPLQERAPQVNPLDAIFEKMKPGQRLACPSGDEQRIKGAMERWMHKRGLRNKYKVRTNKLCDDGNGGVWLLEA